MGKTLIEKSASFLENIPGEFVREFEDQFCHGQTWAAYAGKLPEAFIRDVISFSLTHQDYSYFQYKANLYIGNETIRQKMLAISTEKGDESDGVHHDEPKNSAGSFSENKNAPKKAAVQSDSNKSVMPQQKRGTHGRLYQPDKSHTDTELKTSIEFKLFHRPWSHDRYTRLTKEEIRFIRKNAGLSKKEREVFLEKCGNEYLSYNQIAYRLGCSESRIKQIAVRIDKLIRNMIGC